MLQLFEKLPVAYRLQEEAEAEESDSENEYDGEDDSDGGLEDGLRPLIYLL